MSTSYRVSLQINGKSTYRDFESSQKARDHVMSLEYRIKARVSTQYDAIGIFRIIPQAQAHKLYASGEHEICELHEDGTESIVESEDIFQNAEHVVFGVCVGTDSSCIPFS